MKVSSIENTNKKYQRKFSKLGSIAGSAGYITNIALKEKGDIFKSAIKEAEQAGLNPKIGVLTKASSVVFFTLGAALIGSFAGSLIGKAVDKHKMHKQVKELEKEIKPENIEKEQKEEYITVPTDAPIVEKADKEPELQILCQMNYAENKPENIEGNEATKGSEPTEAPEGVN